MSTLFYIFLICFDFEYYFILFYIFQCQFLLELLLVEPLAVLADFNIICSVLSVLSLSSIFPSLQTSHSLTDCPKLLIGFQTVLAMLRKRTDVQRMQSTMMQQQKLPQKHLMFSV